MDDHFSNGRVPKPVFGVKCAGVSESATCARRKALHQPAKSAPASKSATSSEAPLFRWQVVLPAKPVGIYHARTDAIFGRPISLPIRDLVARHEHHRKLARRGQDARGGAAGLELDRPRIWPTGGDNRQPLLRRFLAAGKCVIRVAVG